MDTDDKGGDESRRMVKDWWLRWQSGEMLGGGGGGGGSETRTSTSRGDHQMSPPHGFASLPSLQCMARLLSSLLHFFILSSNPPRSFHPLYFLILLPPVKTHNVNLIVVPTCEILDYGEKLGTKRFFVIRGTYFSFVYERIQSG